MDASVVIGEHTIKVLQGPYTDSGAATPEALSFAESLVAKLDAMRCFAAGKLLSTYNGAWHDDEHGELTEAEFAANLVGPRVVIYDEVGYALVYFGDSEMFGGHSIEVTVSGGELTYAEIVG